MDIVQVTIISFQEQVEGRLAYINRARKPEEILHGYIELLGLLPNYANAVVLPFGEAAQNCFTRLRKLRVRLGTMDLRIASIALTNDCVLLSRNVRDFRRVPDLRVEDWTE